MKANETKVEDFLSSNKTQFVIPVYQRNYDWTVSQCKQLLDDILEVGTSKKMNAHFIGSLVYVHDDVYTATKIKELTISRDLWKGKYLVARSSLVEVKKKIETVKKNVQQIVGL